MGEVEGCSVLGGELDGLGGGRAGWVAASACSGGDSSNLSVKLRGRAADHVAHHSVGRHRLLLLKLLLLSLLLFFLLLHAVAAAAQRWGWGVEGPTTSTAATAFPQFLEGGVG